MSTLERHFSSKELGEAWGISDTKVRRLFSGEPGILLIGEPSRRLGKKLKRRYFTMRIPESVANRVYERLRKKQPLTAEPPRPVRLSPKPHEDPSAASPEP